jgi:hypothetical protein
VDFTADYLKTTGDAPEFLVRNLYAQGSSHVSAPLGQLSPKAHAIKSCWVTLLRGNESIGGNIGTEGGAAHLWGAGARPPLSWGGASHAPRLRRCVWWMPDPSDRRPSSVSLSLADGCFPIIARSGISCV